MNAGNELAISLSVYLSLSKNDMLKKKKKQQQHETKSKTTKKKEKNNFPPRVVEPQTYDVKGQRDIHRAKATLNVKQKLYT